MTIALELAQLVVPGIGPVVEVLKLVNTAVGEMQESSELCARVYEQLVFLHDKLRVMERKRTLPSDAILTKYTRLVGDFIAFLDKHKRKSWIYRVVKYKRVVAYIGGVQQDIATLVLAFNMCDVEASADERAEMATFREQQRRFFEQQQQFFQQQQHTIAARLTADAVVAQEVAHEAQQVEALSVLRYELQSGGGTAANSADSASNTRAADLDLSATVLRTALDKVMRRSSVRVESVPAWFLPPHKVEFDAQAFARGSFGSVHYGTMGFADVVVKCLLVDTRDNAGVTSRFRREADVWFALRHRHVLTLYGACDVSSPPFLVCERARNGNLFAFLGRSQTNRAMALRLLREAASGLAHLHDQRVVHGDLKCDNILIMSDCSAKVADFSFSYVRTLSASKNSHEASGSGVSGGSSTAGALRWRAPECLLARRPTFASDVFSFGMCIVEALSQELPWGYHVDSDDTVRYMVLEGELPAQPENVPDRVWALVTRMCAFNPSDRPRIDVVITELGKLEGDNVTGSLSARAALAAAPSYSAIDPFASLSSPFDALSVSWPTAPSNTNSSMSTASDSSLLSMYSPSSSATTQFDTSPSRELHMPELHSCSSYDFYERGRMDTSALPKSHSAPGAFSRESDTFGSNNVGTNDTTSVANWRVDGITDPKLLALKIRWGEIEDIKMICIGAFADVWLVKVRGSEILASKRLAKRYADIKHRQDAFVDEVKLAAALHHPRILELKGVAWLHSGTMQALFEYMDSGDLRDYLQNPQVPHEWTTLKFQIAVDVAEALVYLHSFQPPRVRRNGKSRNVLLESHSSGGVRAKLTGFCVARNDRVTGGVSSLKWTAPEVMSGDGDYGAAVDVFSLGGMLSELDTHALPYHDARDAWGNPLSVITLIQHVSNGKLVPSVSTYCPPKVAELVRTCCALQPADRPSATQVLYELRKLLDMFTRFASM